MPKKTSDLEFAKRLMILAKGEPGSWKTCSLATFPGPIYFFDLDGRMAPVRKMLPDRKDIFYDTYGPLDFVKFVEALERMAGQKDYRTVVIDSLTALARMAINTSIRLNDRKKKSGVYMPEIQDWMYEARGLSQVLDAARQGLFNCHFIMVAHVVKSETPQLGGDATIETRQLLTGGRKIAAEIPAYFDEVWHFQVRPGGNGMVGEVITQSGGKDFAKTALPLPKAIDITYPKRLFDEIQKCLAAYNTKLEDGSTPA